LAAKYKFFELPVSPILTVQRFPFHLRPIGPQTFHILHWLLPPLLTTHVLGSCMTQKQHPSNTKNEKQKSVLNKKQNTKVFTTAKLLTKPL
jgi:hypothetical protein